jgi:pescadillo protein
MDIKVFVSIKGIYYQAEIMGEQVTWIMGHERSIGRSNEMDFSVVANFVEFYTRMLSFVNYRLYKSIGLYYPPTLSNFTNVKGDNECIILLFNLYNKFYTDFFDNLDSEDNRIALLAYPLKLESKQEMDEAKIDSFVDNEINEKLHELQMLKTLFKGCNFFLNREVPKESLTLVIRACGGRTSWEDLPESISESSEFITHQIVDRNIPSARINRCTFFSELLNRLLCAITFMF